MYISLSHTHTETCSERCYADGDGYGLGVTTNVVCGFVLVFQVVTKR